jgi:hypothetical protein
MANRAGPKTDACREKRHQKFYSANAVPIPVVADVDVELKIGGISMPFTVSVVDKLSFDLILGMDFFRETGAVVILRTKVLSLFDGLTSVPMTTTGEHGIVSTVSSVKIPPYSETIFPVRTRKKLPVGDYIIEGNLQAPSRALAVARVLVKGPGSVFSCRVLNPTNATLTLRRATPIGSISAVHVNENKTSRKQPDDAQITLSQMQHELEQ